MFFTFALVLVGNALDLLRRSVSQNKGNIESAVLVIHIVEQLSSLLLVLAIRLTAPRKAASFSSPSSDSGELSRHTRAVSEAPEVA